MAEVEKLDTNKIDAPQQPAETNKPAMLGEQVPEEQRLANRTNLKTMGTIYGVVTVASLVLFGAGHTWASISSWPLAFATAAAAAFIAGMVLSSITHEWGHYSGAALSGSNYKITPEPVNHFFFLNFNAKRNTTNQALWMSVGGITGSWLLVLAIALLVPLGSWASAILLATVFGRAVNASIFEMPIVWRTLKSQDFKTELANRLESPGVVKTPGLVVGLALLAVIT